MAGLLNNRIEISVLTNALAARQPSMLGYGELILSELSDPLFSLKEMRASSLFARPSERRANKMLLNLDRFISTPLRSIGRVADIVHVVDPGNAVYLPLMRAKASIVVVHDLIPYLALDGRLEGFTPTSTGRLLMKSILAALMTADAIVAVSHRTRQDLIDISNVSPDRIRVIHNAAFQPMNRATSTEVAAFCARHHISVCTPIIMHIGRNFYKNRLMVLATFEKVIRVHTDSQLVLVGAPDRALADAIANSPARDAITILEHINADELTALYTAASVLLFPSIYEGFGYPILEAQMCGTPVVCSNGGSLPEVAGDAALVHDPSDANSMAQSILHILEDQLLTDKLVSAGFANAHRFSLKRWRDEYIDLYKEMSVTCFA